MTKWSTWLLLIATVIACVSAMVVWLPPIAKEIDRHNFILTQAGCQAAIRFGLKPVPVGDVCEVVGDLNGDGVSWIKIDEVVFVKSAVVAYARVK